MIRFVASLVVVSTGFAPACAQPFKLPDNATDWFPNKNHPLKPLPALGNDPLDALKSLYLRGEKATNEQLTSDMTLLKKTFAPETDGWRLAVKRKLIPNDAKPKQAEQLIASIWWDVRVGPSAVPFGKDLTEAQLIASAAHTTLVLFTSVPDGVEVLVNSQRVGKTKMNEKLSHYLNSKQKHQLLGQKDGYKNEVRKDYMPPEEGDDIEFKMSR